MAAAVQIEVEVLWQVQSGSHQTTVTVGMTGDTVMVPFVLMLDVMVGMIMEDVPEVTFAGGGTTSPNATPKSGEYVVPAPTCDREST